MSHYFINDKALKEDKKTINFKLEGIELKLITDSGVFSRNYVDFGSSLLLKNITAKNPKIIIDMGCGYGVMGIYLAKKYNQAEVYLYDINEKAIELSILNAKNNNASNVYAQVSQIFESNKKKADLIVSNPPVRAGKEVVFKIYEEATKHLKKDGELVIVLQKKQGALSSIKYLDTLYEEVRLVSRDKGYHIISAKHSRVIDIL